MEKHCFKNDNNKKLILILDLIYDGCKNVNIFECFGPN